ncbi:DNA repair and recombination protein RAD54B-like [Hylaeus volcanicus]|uniref:DNA repair and recombination protein RAD54B-like n=1 Tax=Hylaeus volcanicus TaxID=313075 RepID=UPI0023B7C0C6|nr:DNA repair and recombination protein RAD54B-like [Hylaeus volcanicus]
MYRNNQIRGFKSLLKCQQSTSGKSTENLETVNQSFESSDQTSRRSTKRVLNLFKKPVECDNEELQERNDHIKTNENNTVNEENSASLVNNSRIIFNVVIGKKSARKHKKWDDDGTLEVTGKWAVLKNSEGGVIQRTVVNPENLVEGFRICINNKEIEIIDRATSSQSVPSEPIKELIPEPPRKKMKTSSSCLSSLPLGSLKKGLKLTCNPLVMPSLSNLKSWIENDVPEKEEEVSVDACLVNALRPHQRHGVVFLYECIMGLNIPNYFGAILADEMGLGKTLQCITIIWTLLKKGPYGKPVVKYVLVITPSSLCDNWNKEFGRWLGFHRIFPYVVNTKNKVKDFKKQARNSIMIISYDMLIRCEEELEQIAFDLIVCDEGHRLKNNDIKAAKVLNNMNCKRRILLSGTPIQNDLQEFFALIDFVNPGILGSNYEFKNYYENPIVASRCPHAPASVVSLGIERASELNEKTKVFVLRRTQDTINKYLPSKHELVVFCRLSDEQEHLYSHVTDAWFNRTVLPNNNISHLTVITILKKICNHPDLFYKESNDFLHDDLKTLRAKACSTSNKAYCGKISVIQTLMRNLKETDEKLVLVSYYTQTLDLLETVCNTESVQFLRLDGSTPNSSRSKIIGQFNSKSDCSKVFLLSAKAGGVGLNLPGASRLVLFDSDWNPASDSQAMARIWRDGQKRDVYILRLLTTGTIEEKIFQRQVSKAGLSETVVDQKNFASLKLSMSELKDLFTLTRDTDCLTHDLMKCPCNGYKQMEKKLEKLDHENIREHQFLLESETPQQKLTINQLLEWEHYQRPVLNKVMQEIMLSNMSDNITFIFKNSILNKTI